MKVCFQPEQKHSWNRLSPAPQLIQSDRALAREAYWSPCDWTGSLRGTTKYEWSYYRLRPESPLECCRADSRKSIEHGMHPAVHILKRQQFVPYEEAPRLEHQVS